MKKIFLIYNFIVLLFFLSGLNSAHCEEPGLKSDDYDAYEGVLEPQDIYESPVLLDNADNHIRIFEPELLEIPQKSTHSKFYESMQKTAHDIYELQVENTNVPASLLEKPLTWNFESGPVEQFHLWGAIQTGMAIDFENGKETSAKYSVGLINVIMDGKFRGGKEEFRLMLDPTPRNNSNYMKRFVQDAYIQTKRIPHHSVLVGHSRPGVGIEGAQSPYTLPLLNRSQISRNFANVRKTGIRVRGNYSLVDYDLGGYSSDTFFTEFFPGVEFNGWVNIKPLGKTDGRFGKLVTGGGIAAGERNSVDFLVSGAYIGYEYKKLWMRAEYANADGSNGASGLTSKQREGWYATLGYHLTKKLELIARYDEFDPDKNISHNNKREYTAGVNYYIKGQALKVVLNYVFCQNQSDNDSHRLLMGTQIAL